MSNNKKPKVKKVDPLFIMGLYNSLGGPIENPNNTDVSGMLPQQSYDRINLNKETGKSAVTGAIQGASFGANPLLAGATGGLSVLAGAAIGGIAGGISGRNNARDVQDLNEQMFKDNYEPISTFALGGNMPDGDPIDDKDKNPPASASPPPVNPTFSTKERSFTTLSGAGSQDSRWLTPEEILEYNKGANTNGTITNNRLATKVLYDVNSNSYYPEYGETGTRTPPVPRERINPETTQPNPFKPGFREIILTGEGYPAVDNPNAKTQIKLPYTTEEEARKLQADFRNIKSYKDYKASPYYAKYGDSVLKMANGGYLDNGGSLNVDNIQGPRHEEGGVPMAGNEVEGGEAKLGSYIFSDRLKRDTSKRTFAQHAKAVELKYKDRDNDGPAQRSKSKELESLMAENEISRKQEEFKQQQLNSLLEADAYAYGGYLKANGGNIEIDSKMIPVFKNLAKQRGLNMDEYKTRLMAYGGNLERNPPYNTSIVDNMDQEDPRMDYLNQSLNLSELGGQDPTMIESFIRGNNNGIKDIYNLANKNRGLNETPEDQMSSEESTDPSNKNFNFGNEEAGLLMSNLPALGNFAESLNKRKTTFNRFNPATISLDAQRDEIENEYAKAKNITRENIRGNATNAGQALSNMAASNASLTDSLSGDLSQSFLNEENANTQIRNQAGMLNTEIGNQEIIANEQNADLRKSLQNKALSDVAMNTQGYLRDKKMTSENIRQNDRLMSMINNVFPQYKWENDNGEFAIKFIKQMEEANSMLPPAK